MAMRRFTWPELKNELEGWYPCDFIQDNGDGTSDWQTTEDNRRFMVPTHPEEADGKYADFIIDQIITRHGLTRFAKPRLKAVGTKETT